MLLGLITTMEVWCWSCAKNLKKKLYLNQTSICCKWHKNNPRQLHLHVSGPNWCSESSVVECWSPQNVLFFWSFYHQTGSVNSRENKLSQPQLAQCCFNILKHTLSSSFPDWQSAKHLKFLFPSATDSPSKKTQKPKLSSHCFYSKHA